MDRGPSCEGRGGKAGRGQGAACPGKESVFQRCTHTHTHTPSLGSPSLQVITDAGSGRSKGYGFVRFGAEAERDKASPVRLLQHKFEREL